MRRCTWSRASSRTMPVGSPCGSLSMCPPGGLGVSLVMPCRQPPHWNEWNATETPGNVLHCSQECVRNVRVRAVVGTAARRPAELVTPMWRHARSSSTGTSGTTSSRSCRDGYPLWPIRSWSHPNPTTHQPNPTHVSSHTRRTRTHTTRHDTHDTRHTRVCDGVSANGPSRLEFSGVPLGVDIGAQLVLELGHRTHLLLVVPISHWRVRVRVACCVLRVACRVICRACRVVSCRAHAYLKVEVGQHLAQAQHVDVRVVRPLASAIADVSAGKSREKGEKKGKRTGRTSLPSRSITRVSSAGGRATEGGWPSAVDHTSTMRPLVVSRTRSVWRWWSLPSVEVVAGVAASAALSRPTTPVVL
jgi:hypothetical protein